MPPTLQQIREEYQQAFTKYDGLRRTPPIEVSFYPYVGINHTIRIREGSVYVRIGEICRQMPLSAHRGLAHILVAKLYRRKAPAEKRQLYSAYIDRPEIRDRASDMKRERGRKVVTSSEGTVYDLDSIFAALNARYFKRRVKKPVLTWSARKTYRILGHHDATHGVISISRSLDSKSVPRFVVEYVMFHEMLHIVHPTKTDENGRRLNHTPAFRRDERKYFHFNAAERWIEENVRHLKREAKKKAKA
ncbi:MAG: M48 family peptidase [Acidobacteria bacterium]|nr:M48 family peptidase [Acidobacteriota bacterium]